MDNLRGKPLDEIVLDDFIPGKSEIVGYWIPRLVDIRTIAAVVKEASGKEKPLLLDLGSGSGLYSRLLSDTELEVLGIDDNEQYVLHAAQIYGNGNTRFIQSDVENLQQVVQGIGLPKVDAVHCSFMPKGKNWTALITGLNPSAIIYVCENFEDPDESGSFPHAVLNPEGYTKYLLGPVISRRDILPQNAAQSLNNSLSICPESTWMVVYIRKDIFDTMKDRRPGIISANGAANGHYPWEKTLSDRLAEAKQFYSLVRKRAAGI